MTGVQTCALHISNGNTEATPNKEPLNWYHPNKIGHEKLAEALIEKISIPPSAHPAGASPNDDVPNPEIRETVSAWIQGHYAHQIGKPLTLDARGSYSDHGAPVKYEWDLDGDGRYEIESTEPMLAHTWDSEYVADSHADDSSHIDAESQRECECDSHRAAQHRSKHQP